MPVEEMLLNYGGFGIALLVLYQQNKALNNVIEKNTSAIDFMREEIIKKCYR